MPRIQQIRRSFVDQRCAYLKTYARNITSQNGEDGIIAKSLEIMGINSDSNLWCVEFGAWDGKHLSNTYSLINGNGASGVLIEANPERFADLQRTHGANNKVFKVCQRVGFDDEKDSLDFILSQTPIPQDFAVLSIDIDGNDWYIWESLKKYRPKLVVIEFNPSVPNDIVFVQDKDAKIYQGCSLRALIELGREKSYELVCATNTNGIFVPREEYAKFNIPNNDIFLMFDPLMDGKIFHGYDGTIYHAGMDNFLWRPEKIPRDSLQVLTPEERASWHLSI